MHLPPRNAAWENVRAHADRVGQTHLRELFTAADRVQSLCFTVEELLFDFSKQRLDAAALDALVALAAAADVEGWRERMFAGDRINASEDRAVLHVALRAPANTAFPRADFDVMPQVAAARQRMSEFADAVRSGRWLGHTGQAIRNVVNIGIGGSDLGPKMATQALRALAHPALAVHHVSNLDSAQLAPLLQSLDPRTTLFIIVSKTFTTQETMINAQSARDWLVANLGTADAVPRHFVAVSAATDRAATFGLPAANLFPMWDWVGGRFSLWSAVGLPLMLAIGPHAFDPLLAGAAAIDRHFRTAPLARNVPVLMALIGIWNTDFLGAETLAVLPYNESLRELPAYLQQLEMESNGKSVGRDGALLTCRSAPILWGELGNNGQHAFFQLLHQGGRIVPCDFIAAVNADYPLAGHQQALLANCFAQSSALAFGRTAAEVLDDHAAKGGLAPELLAQKTFPGNQPSTTLLLPRLDPHSLGALIALYEHKVFVQGILWGINSFDQWGVELGKAVANRILPAFADPHAAAGLDASTRALLDYCHRHPH